MTRPLRFLVSAGPTHEPIDAVRYIANRSSGTLGMALAEEILRRGHQLTLVLGPTHLTPPASAVVEHVETAAEMLAALQRHFTSADVLIMAAAVADVKPRQQFTGKLKKDELGLQLLLEKNPDILCELGRIRSHQVVVGFALESLGGDAALAEAARKARDHGCDLVVLNGAKSMGGDGAEGVSFVRPDGTHAALGDLLKSALAQRLVEWCEREGRKSS